MKAKERRDKVREMTAAELDLRLLELKKELFNLRFQHATNQLENPMRIVAVKKEIALIKTIQHEQELGEEVLR